MLKGARKPLPADPAQTSGVNGVGIRPRSRATSPAPLLRDGDLIPFSMTIAFLASCVDRCIPRPEMVLLLISVVLVPLVGEFGL